ncbi:MAG: Ig-like domain-containing protein [Thermodesulfobacteriota bacterium]
MRQKRIVSAARRLGLLAAAWSLALAATPALAADYYLCAQEFVNAMPDSVSITMWGFASDDDNDLANGCGTGQPAVPGPLLSVAPGDPVLNIHLRNELAAEPVSIVIPGQTAAMTPVFFTDDQGRRRVHSFTQETPENGAGVVTYTFGSLAQPFRPGSFVYHSGTHPQVQVQMGLYGSAVKDAAPGEIYPGVPYDAQVSLFYSEIDPALHEAVANGTYGTPPMTSTIDYRPGYFLVNGEPQQAGTAPLAAGFAGGRTLIRFFNMGLLNHVPLLQGGHLQLVAENGSPYPFPQEAYSLLLPASGTRDAIFVPTATGDYPVYDRMLSLTNSTGATGGLLSVLSVAGAPPTDSVTILRTRYDVATDELRVWANSTAAPDAILTLPDHGGAVMDKFPNNPNFKYREYVPGVGGNPGTVTVNSDRGGSDTRPVEYTAPPVAAGDAFAAGEGAQVIVPAAGVLANDSRGGWWASATVLVAQLASGPSSGTVALAADGGFTYTHDGSETVVDSFSYRAVAVNSNNNRVQAVSQPATVIITITPGNDAPVVVAPLADAQGSEGAWLEKSVAASFADPEGQALFFSMTGPPAGSGLAIDAATGLISGILTAADAAASPYPIAVRATDPVAAFVEDSFLLTVQGFSNSAPVVGDDYALTTVAAPVLINILANDTDDGQPVVAANVTASVLGLPLRDAGGQIVTEKGTDGVLYPVKITKKGGQAVYRGDGTVRYTPATTFVGSDVFKYVLTDHDPVAPLTSQRATVRVSVVP